MALNYRCNCRDSESNSFTVYIVDEDRMLPYSIAEAASGFCTSVGTFPYDKEEGEFSTSAVTIEVTVANDV